jgi:tRNA-dihydrouridine synthase
MKCYFAPLEGITGYIYRNAHHKYFGGIDRYYTPFLVPTHTERLTSREINDILPEHNEGMQAVPQILTNHAENFMWAARKIQELGYDEINLNLGCPSPTVVPKKRGAGFLAVPDELDRFLAKICRDMDEIGMKLSVKTRIGMDDPEEFEDLLNIFNQYSFTELIVHPRVRSDFYKNHPHMEAFALALAKSKNPVCYNGDLFTIEDVQAFQKEYPSENMIMLGRGLIANPALAETVNGIGGLDKIRLKAFHDEVMEGYREVVSGDRPVLYKMKEFWWYLGNSFENYEKYGKKIKKSQHLAEYQVAVQSLFDDQELKASPGFRAGGA